VYSSMQEGRGHEHDIAREEICPGQDNHDEANGEAMRCEFESRKCCCTELTP
jgi:hypothetical protein